ncbi:MAG: thioredoxin-disulfide reductase [Planctomycetota bacterium]
MHDVIIIGGGPAGLTAGLYACRAGCKAALIEPTAPGGMIINTDHIENYPGFPDGINGFELAQLIEKQAVKFGLEIINARAGRINVHELGFTVTPKDSPETAAEAKSVIIASGTTPRALKVPGHDIFMGKGVSYCGTCDGPLFKNKRVAVAGGGNSAIEEALFLTRFAAEVIVIHRRDQLRAADILKKRAFANPRIKFIYNAVVAAINGQKKIESVTLAPAPGKQIQTLVPVANGNLAVDGIFIFIGTTPNTGCVPDSVRTDSDGYIITDVEMKTSQPGIFAAGDVRSQSFRQVVTACGDGARAAFSAQHYLENL